MNIKPINSSKSFKSSPNSNAKTKGWISTKLTSSKLVLCLITILIINNIRLAHRNHELTDSIAQLDIHQRQQMNDVNSNSLDSIPIVYTYSEESPPDVENLLKVSILSIKQHMPNTSIEILYHKKRRGSSPFQQWLKDQGVSIHDHSPSWHKVIKKRYKEYELIKQFNAGSKDQMEEYDDRGSYIADWQRIDISKYVSVDRCIVMNHDAILVSPLKISDFAEIQKPIALTPLEEGKEDETYDVGMMVINAKHLRETYDEFYESITIKDSSRTFPLTVKQAIGSFYEHEYLDGAYNFKAAHWVDELTWDKSFIVSLRDASPYHIMDVNFFGKWCMNERDAVCAPIETTKYMCPAVELFAGAAKAGGDDAIQQFCTERYEAGMLGVRRTNFAEVCVQFLNDMATQHPGYGHGKLSGPSYCTSVLAQARKMCSIVPDHRRMTISPRHYFLLMGIFSMLYFLGPMFYPEKSV